MSSFYDKRDDELFNFDEIDNDVFDDDELDKVLDEIQEIKHTIQGLPNVDFPVEDNYSASEGYYDDVKMARNNDGLKAELRRVISRLSDMQIDGANLNGQIERLISLNDEQIRISSESQDKLRAELESLKKMVGRVGASSDVTNAIAELKSGIKNANDYIVNISNSIDSLSKAPSKQSDVDNDVNTEIMRQIFELKCLIGSPTRTAKHNSEILEMYNTLSQIRLTVKDKNISILDKLSLVDSLAKRLKGTSDSEVQPIVSSLNEIILDLGAQPLTASMADVIFNNIHLPYLNVTASRRESVKSYYNSVESILKDGLVDNMDDLTDIIALKNEIQQHSNEIECENTYNAVLNTNIALLSEKDYTTQRALRLQMKQQISHLVELQLSDLVLLSPITISKTVSVSSRLGENDGLFNKLSDLRSIISDPNSPKIVYKTVDGEEIKDIPDVAEKSNFDDSLTARNVEVISQAIYDLKGDCLTIINKLEEKKEPTVDSEIMAGIPTLNEIVSQLDRLFEDVKNLITDSENNIMSSVEVVGEALKQIADESSVARADREKLLTDVSFIRSFLEKDDKQVLKQSDDVVEVEQVETSESLANDSGGEVIATNNADQQLLERLDKLEANQIMIMESLNSLTTMLSAKANEISEMPKKDEQALPSNADVLDEIKRLREQVFGISMANVTEGEESRFESYNSLILNEVYDISDALLDVRETMQSEFEQKNVEDSSTNDKEQPQARKEIKPKTSAKNKQPRKINVTLPTKRKKHVVSVSNGDEIDAILSKIANTDNVLDD